MKNPAMVQADDPIFRIADQLPLANPSYLAGQDDGPWVHAATRPFGLRYLTPVASDAVVVVDRAAVYYDPVSQMAFIRDSDELTPLCKHTSGATETQTQSDDKNAPDTDEDHEPD